jgi:SNF2 family DNA or RNA helicase
MFSCVIPDEIHNVKDITTLTAESVFRMKPRRKIGPTGTLLSNSAMDAYWIMAWVIGGPRDSFPYLHMDGRAKFEERFCEHVIMEKPTGQKDDETGEEIKKSIRRRLPYLKSAPDWWKFAAPKIIRRNYSDPLYLASLEKAGMYKPPTEIKVMKVPMVPKQVKCMLSALKDFKDIYEKAKAEAEAKQQEINKTFVMSQMVAMRIIATVPEFINKRFDQEVYDGVSGGGKMYHITTIAKDRFLDGKKVVILSDFIEMQKAVDNELKGYGGIRFDTSWDDDERREAFEKFSNDDNVKYLIAGTRAVSEGLDFSVADTCICCDILWAPATQSQAWSRILAPTARIRNCEIFIVLSENSIDEHMYNVFYSKLQMAEQAMDHRTINRRAMEINYQWFAERIIQEEANLSMQLRGEGDTVTVLVPNEDTYEERD